MSLIMKLKKPRRSFLILIRQNLLQKLRKSFKMKSLEVIKENPIFVLILT